MFSGETFEARSYSWITFRRVFRTSFERTAQRGPECRRGIIFQELFCLVTVALKN